MIAAEKDYDALFEDPPFRDDESIRFPVIAWDDNGYAMIVDVLSGKLVSARGMRGFVKLERTSLA